MTNKMIWSFILDMVRHFKALFSKHGKVITAKIFTTKNKQSPTCFGYVTLVDSETADICAEKLHRSNFKGRIINVEKVNIDLMSLIFIYFLPLSYRLIAPICHSLTRAMLSLNNSKTALARPKVRRPKLPNQRLPLRHLTFQLLLAHENRRDRVLQQLRIRQQKKPD